MLLCFEGKYPTSVIEMYFYKNVIKCFKEKEFFTYNSILRIYHYMYVCIYSIVQSVVQE